MDELTDLIIKEVGERALCDLPDIFARGWYLPITDPDQIDKIRGAFSEEKCKELQRGVIYNQIEKRREERKEELQSTHRRTTLASRIPGHDLSNLWAPFGAQVGAVHHLRYWESRSPEEKLENAEFLLKVLVPYRAFCLAMAYLASDGDERFVWKIPMRQLPYCTPSKREGIDWNGEGNYRVGSPEYVALCQILKNAPTGVTVEYGDTGAYDLIAVEDSGEGIRDQEGRPLPPERLGEIFDDFTTKKDGGGLGLQVAKELVHLRKGDITVVTTTRGEGGNQTYAYNTGDRIGTVFPPQEQTGTRFLINIWPTH